MGQLEHQTAIITGAGTGIGLCVAKRFHHEGAFVVICGRTLETLERAAAEISPEGQRILAVPADIANEEQVQNLVAQAVARTGRVDILINNAGILRDKAFHKMDSAQIDAVIDVHLKGAFYVTAPAFRLMREQGYGRIISTSSASGLFGNFGQANYGAAKAGLAGLTRVLALEGAGHGISANAIAPIAATQMTQGILGDLAAKVSPDSVSPLVAYLSHEVCEVNGHVYSVAGGRVARIFVGETLGVVLPENTAEGVRDHLALIDQVDLGRYHLPSSLDDETTIIAKALSEIS
jgi:NAD(P)-dependent dehydrogenase (short-subunit alcohol dehydrogenase family)